MICFDFGGFVDDGRTSGFTLAGSAMVPLPFAFDAKYMNKTQLDYLCRNMR